MHPNRIPTEVVISHMGVRVIMRMCVRPSLTRDSSSRGVCFSNIVTAWCWLLLAANMFWISIIFGGFRTNVVEQFKENQNKQKLCKRFTLHYVSSCLVRIGNQKRSFDWSKRFMSSCTRHSQGSRQGNSQLSFCSLSLHNISCGKVPLLLLQHFRYYWVDVEGSSYVT